MTAAPRFDPRRPMIAKVKIAQKELGLDDVVYRAILQRVTGQVSAAACTLGQLGDVLDELKTKGWTPRVVVGSAPRKPVAHNKQADHPAAKKARALWISLAQLGVVRDRRESALEAFAARQLGVDRLQWADQGLVYKLIEALKAMAERAGWSQDVAGVTPADQVGVLKARLQLLLDKQGGGVA